MGHSLWQVSRKVRIHLFAFHPHQPLIWGLHSLPMICSPRQTKQARGGPVVLRPVYRRSPGSHWLAVQSGTSAGWGPACTRRHRPGAQPDRQPQGKKTKQKKHHQATLCPLSHHLSPQNGLELQHWKLISKEQAQKLSLQRRHPPCLSSLIVSSNNKKQRNKPHQSWMVNSAKVIALKS